MLSLYGFDGYHSSENRRGRGNHYDDSGKRRENQSRDSGGGEIAGVDRISKFRWCTAIGALAYGTESVPRVDKIVGPGNAFVAEAKKQVFGRVSIDMIAGPSEILILADDTCDAEIVAADMLSQAEHDTMASAVLVTDSERLADAVSAELERQIPLLPRAKLPENPLIIAAKSFWRNP